MCLIIWAFKFARWACWAAESDCGQANKRSIKLNKTEQINIHERAFDQINKHLITVKDDEKQSPKPFNPPYL